MLGDATFDIWLNDHAFWRNVPAAVWNYRLGGYQVLKKWLSYREQFCIEASLSNRRKCSTSPTPPAASQPSYFSRYPALHLDPPVTLEWPTAKSLSDPDRPGHFSIVRIAIDPRLQSTVRRPRSARVTPASHAFAHISSSDAPGASWISEDVAYRGISQLPRRSAALGLADRPRSGLRALRVQANCGAPGWRARHRADGACGS